jgi:hypothetical protein
MFWICYTRYTPTKSMNTEPDGTLLSTVTNYVGNGRQTFPLPRIITFTVELYYYKHPDTQRSVHSCDVGKLTGYYSFLESPR